MSLTNRERKLMKKAFFLGFDHGMNDAENGYSNCNLDKLFDDLMSEPVSDSGHTVEMAISTEAGD